MPADHHTIASNFRNNAGGRNAERASVTINDRRLGKRKSRDRQTVDKEMFGQRRQARHCSLHG